MISFEHPTVFNVLGIPVTTTVVTTWGLIVLLAIVSFVAGRNLKQRPTGWQAVVEWGLIALSDMLDEMTGNARPYVALVASIGLFVLVANLSSMLPGVEAPTADLNTPVALAIVVFFSVHYFGVRQRGFRDYLASFARPNPLLLPMNLLTNVTRSISLSIRLFGNMLSHQVIVAVLLLILPLVVPAILEIFGLAIGVLQAYIFTILTAVYIGGAVRGEGGV